MRAGRLREPYCQPELHVRRRPITKPKCKSRFLRRSIFVCAFLVSLILLSSAPAICARALPPQAEAKDARKNTALTLAAYADQLKQISEQISGVKFQSAKILQLRRSLPAAWNVNAPGQRFQISTRWLDSALANLQMQPKNADELAREIKIHLGELREAAMEMENPAATVSAAEARARLKEILARREFQGIAGPTALQLFEQRVERWLFGIIESLLKRLHISAKMGNRLAWGFITLVFLLIVYWAYRTLSARTRAIEMPSAEGAMPETSRQWVSEALAAADRGEYREAIHCGYWAAIARLEDLKLLARERSRTPRESLRLLRAHSEERGALENLTTRFELVWYGCRTASADDWSGAKLQLEKFGCLRASTRPIANS